MKILFVFNHPAPYKVEFLNGLAKHYELDVIFERSKNNDRPDKFYFEHNYSFNECKIKGIEIGNENFLSYGIIKHLKKHKYDLIIMNGYSQFSEMLALRYIKRKKLPYCFYINGGIINPNENGLKKRLKTNLIKGANFYLSPDENSNKYLEYYGAEKTKIYNYSYATIHESEILKNKPSIKEIEALKKELNISSKNVFISSGQLIKRKNYLELIKAWQKQPDDRLLLIAGSGNLEDELKDYIKENSINNVVLLGFLNRNELFKYYKVCNGFIFPSNEDIYGHVVNEAMSQGLPVISTPNINASKHLIKQGENGFIISNVFSNKFSEYIEQILSKNMFNNCIKTASENTYEIMVKQHVKILNNWEKNK